MILTVNQLLEECEKQKSKGNGNKKVYISRDDEGNDFHALFYGFTDDKKTIKEINDYCGSIDDIDNSIILG